MSFPEVQPRYRVALSKTKGCSRQERRGAVAEDGSSRSRLTLRHSEGIHRCSLHPAPLAGPMACGTTKAPGMHRARQL